MSISETVVETANETKQYRINHRSRKQSELIIKKVPLKNGKVLTFTLPINETLYSRFLKIRDFLLKRDRKIFNLERFNNFLYIAKELDREFDRIIDILNISVSKNDKLLSDKKYLTLYREFNKLTKLEKEIIQKFTVEFLYENDNNLSLECVGILYSMTRERVRQIEFKVLRKLRSPLLREKIGNFKNDYYM